MCEKSVHSAGFLHDFLKNSDRKVVQLSWMTIHGYPFILGGKKVRLHCRKINMKTDV